MEIVALVVAIIALVVAIMALPFLSKPKWRVSYDSAKGYKLWCWIRNLPVGNRVLIWMGYERRIQRIMSTITITDQRGEIVSFLPYPATSSDDIRIGIVEIKSAGDGHVFLKDTEDEFGAMLNTGLYALELSISDDNGRELATGNRRFRVNSKYPFVEWTV